MSDTPRMKAAQMASIEHRTGDVWRVGCDLERELNVANDRIRQLEEAGSEMQKWLLSYDEHYVYALNVINNWNKAKESK